MRTKILAAFIAGGLLVGAGFATSIVSAPGTAQAQEDGDSEESDGPLQRILGLLGGVLDDLVDDDTITQDQADAISSAVEDEFAELREDHLQKRRNFRRGVRFGALLDDGGIDESEYEDLGENHPLKQLDVDRYFEDGLITPEELREILHALKDAPFGDS